MGPVRWWHDCQWERPSLSELTSPKPKFDLPPFVTISCVSCALDMEIPTPPFQTHYISMCAKVIGVTTDRILKPRILLRQKRLITH